MRIAVLGWGSLLWSHRTLAIDGRSWKPDGPFLPVEFSRISRDGRLTLVIDPLFSDVQVYWHEMLLTNLPDARYNLMEREAAEKLDEVGFIDLTCNNCCMRHDLKHLNEKISSWGKTKNLDAVIWTDLRPTFFEKTGWDFTLENAVAYLKTLEGKTRRRAQEYILNSPLQTQTRYRKYLENVFLIRN